MGLVRAHPFFWGFMAGAVVGLAFPGTLKKIPGVSKIPQKS